MTNNVIAVVPLRGKSLVVWFEGGVSKSYLASDLGITKPEQLASVCVLSDGSGITWEGSSGIPADDLFAQGSVIDFVQDEKQRLLKSLSGIRRDASFSQTRLGEAAGIRQSVISRIEGCEISPQINTLLKLLAPLGKTLAIVDLSQETE